MFRVQLDWQGLGYIRLDSSRYEGTRLEEGTKVSAENIDGQNRQGGRDLHRMMRFILLLGTVSLFADMTYEGARGITGPFLSLLGATAAAAGITAGAGEIIGYGIRLVSGYLADRTGGLLGHHAHLLVSGQCGHGSAV